MNNITTINWTQLPEAINMSDTQPQTHQHWILTRWKKLAERRWLSDTKKKMMRIAIMLILSGALLMIPNLYLRRCAIFVGLLVIRKTLLLVHFVRKAFTHTACSYLLMKSMECTNPIGNAWTVSHAKYAAKLQMRRSWCFAVLVIDHITHSVWSLKSIIFLNAGNVNIAFNVNHAERTNTTMSLMLRTAQIWPTAITPYQRISTYAMNADKISIRCWPAIFATRKQLLRWIGDRKL